VQGALELIAVGSQGKARQWTDGGRSDAEKIGRAVENTGKQEHKKTVQNRSKNKETKAETKGAGGELAGNRRGGWLWKHGVMGTRKRPAAGSGRRRLPPQRNQTPGAKTQDNGIRKRPGTKQKPAKAVTQPPDGDQTETLRIGRNSD
jgi:hypothetical protein